MLGFIGMNPSAAASNINDATVARCERFAHAWGFDGFVMTNVISLRATSLKDMEAYLLNPDLWMWNEPNLDQIMWGLAPCREVVLCCGKPNVRKGALRAFTPYLECSASTQGWHVWVLFAPMVPALKARLLGYGATPSALLADGSPADPRSARGIEIFPKQNAIKAGGYGNLVWLPWWSEALERGGNLFHRFPETGEPGPWEPEEFTTHTEADLDRVIAAEALADRFLTVPDPVAPVAQSGPASLQYQPLPSNTSADEQVLWQEWRTVALARLDQGAVYGGLLTGQPQAPGWLECRVAYRRPQPFGRCGRRHCSRASWDVQVLPRQPGAFRLRLSRPARFVLWFCGGPAARGGPHRHPSAGT
jgi:hypothetical protein